MKSLAKRWEISKFPFDISRQPCSSRV